MRQGTGPGARAALSSNPPRSPLKLQRGRVVGSTRGSQRHRRCITRDPATLRRAVWVLRPGRATPDERLRRQAADLDRPSGSDMTVTMRAVVLGAPGPPQALRVRERPVPEPRLGWV